MANNTSSDANAILPTHRSVQLQTANIESAIEEQTKEITSKTEVLDQRDVERKPLGSGWRAVSIYELAIYIFETRPLRGSSYIENPVKYSNSR